MKEEDSGKLAMIYRLPGVKVLSSCLTLYLLNCRATGQLHNTSAVFASLNRACKDMTMGINIG